MWKVRKPKACIYQWSSGIADNIHESKLIDVGLGSPFLLRLLVKIVEQSSHHSVINDHRQQDQYT